MSDCLSGAEVCVSESSPVGCSSLSVAPTSVISLSLTNFRNYENLSLSLSPAPVVLTGSNGAGKTNLLEAVSLLAPGRGLRQAKLSEIDPEGGKEGTAWAIAALVESGGEEIRIGTGRDTGMSGSGREKRIVKIDGETVRGQSELAKFFSAIWLTPQMDQIFMEGNSVRRRFLDRLVYSFDSKHAARVNAYEHAMSERNRLLAAGRTERAWFEALERKMAELSTAIAATRLDTVARLNHALSGASSLASAFPRAEVRLCGMAEDALLAGKSAVEVEDDIAVALAACRVADSYRGRTSVGAHKSEFIVHHAGRGVVASRCSTGEQKALLLSLVLAQARASKQWHGRLPVLLLDEVIAHLDDSRRAALCEEIVALGCQAWMSGTDKEFFKCLRGKAQFIGINEGCISGVHL